jgi:hypothetical protein
MQVILESITHGVDKSIDENHALVLTTKGTLVACPKAADAPPFPAASPSIS